MPVPLSTSRAMVRHVAEHLGEVREQVVFLGGAVTGLLLTDPAAPEARSTEDVDVVVSVTSYSQYARLEEALRERGFVNVRDVICRWNVSGVVVDVMPTDKTILGFSNRWYDAVMAAATEYNLGEGLTVRLVSAPCFIATKLEAFAHPHREGQGDFLLSRDMQDILAVIDGRPELISEVEAAEEGVRSFLSQSFRHLLQEPDFLEALPGHLPPDEASQQRLSLLKSRCAELGSL